MDVRAIALDIDGTLTNDEKVMTPRTREALLEAQERGVRVILASGRPAHGLDRLSRELELARHGGLLVSFNGGRVTEAGTGAVLFDRPVTAPQVQALLRHLENYEVIPMVTHGDELCVATRASCEILRSGKPVDIIAYEAGACGLSVREVGDLRAFCTGSEGKILTAGTDTYMQAHWRELGEPFMDELACTFTSDVYYEFSAKGTTKGAAIAGVLPGLGIDASQLLAFGDAQNDLSMIRLAGCGVAMGNATPEVKAEANLVCGTNNEDGIAGALEQLLG